MYWYRGKYLFANNGIQFKEVSGQGGDRDNANKKDLERNPYEDNACDEHIAF